MHRLTPDSLSEPHPQLAQAHRLGQLSGQPELELLLEPELGEELELELSPGMWFELLELLELLELELKPELLELLQSELGDELGLELEDTAFSFLVGENKRSASGDASTLVRTESASF